MAFRTVLCYSMKRQFSNTLLNVLRLSLQSKKRRYSPGLPLYHYPCGVYDFQFMSNILNYIYHQFDLKYSQASTKDEVQCLCDFILSQSSENSESERGKELKKVLSFLISEGYSSKEIKEKFAAYLMSGDFSYIKFKTLSDIDPDIYLLLPLLSLPLPLLKSAAKRAKTDTPNTQEFQNRIMYLSHHLELEPSQLISALAKHPALLTMKFNRLVTKMTILKNANISTKYIVKDLWIFNYSEQLLASRVKAAVEAEVELKPWMLRCSESAFESILTKYSEKHRILSGETLQSYLAKKLDCSIEYVNYMMERNKLLKTINIPKLEQIINFLYAKGYTAEEIRLFPRVFCSSVITLEKKFDQVQTIKCTLPTLAHLCMTNKKLRSMSKQK